MDSGTSGAVNVASRQTLPILCTRLARGPDFIEMPRNVKFGAQKARPGERHSLSRGLCCNYPQMGVPAMLKKLAKGGIFADVKCAYDPAPVRARPWRL